MSLLLASPMLKLPAAGGGSPAFVDQIGTSSSGNTTSLTLTLPTYTTGDLLIANFAINGNPSITSVTGWTQMQVDNQFSAVKGACYYRVSTGSDTCTIVMGSNRVCGIVQSFENVSNASASIGDNLSFNPPSHTPASNGEIWIAGAANDSNDNVTAGPSGYASFLTESEGTTASCRMSVAHLVSNAASQDPGAFTGGGGEQNVCWTIALW